MGTFERLSARQPLRRDSWGFSGLALPYGRVFQGRRGPTIVKPGAFTESKTVLVVADSDPNEPTGKAIVRNRADGLFVDAKLSDTSRGREEKTLLDDGVKREIDVGVSVLSESGRDPCVISKGKLWFVSPAIWSPAGPAGAKVHEVHRSTPAVETETRRMRQLREAESYVRNMRITPTQAEENLARRLLGHLCHRFDVGAVDLTWFDSRIGPTDRVGWAEYSPTGSTIHLTTGLDRPSQLLELLLHEFGHILYRHREPSEQAEAEAERFTDGLFYDSTVRAIMERALYEN